MNSKARTVLIVDDAPADRLAYRRFLMADAAYDYTVFEAEQGAEAVALCQQATPDCILLDYRLPDMDGLTLLQLLVRIFGLHGTAIVMLTGVEETDIAVKSLQNGAHDYLRKGKVAAEQVRRAVNYAIEKATLQRELERQREWQRVTLSSIGDAVIATDTAGCITFMNGIAEGLTGWSAAEAMGEPLTTIFPILNEQSRQPVANPVEQVLQSGAIVGLANHTLLVRRDGREVPIDDSAAPIRDHQDNLLGIVLTFRDSSERRRTEEQLRYQAFLLENVQDAVISTDTNFRILTWNRGAEQIYGWSAAEVIGRTVGELLQTKYLTAKPAEVLTHFHTYGRWQGEVMQINQRGEAIPISNTTVLLQDTEGRPIGAVAVNRDIRERKRSEEALRASEAFNRTVMESSPDCVKVLDTEGRLLRMNSPGLCLMEIDDFAPLQDQLWTTLWPAESEPLIRTALASARAGNQGRFQSFCPTAKGTPKWWDVIVAPVRGAAEEITHFVAASRDITESRQVETALRASEERLRLALAGGGMGIWEWHAATDRTIWNEQEYALFGLAPGAEITYTFFENFVHPDERAQLKAILDTIVAQGGDYTYEFRIIRADGEVRWLAEHGTSILDEEGRPLRLLGINFDITERKTQEEALRQLNTELEGRVAERTAALEEVNQQLARSNRELEQFNYAAAHDLKSPLRGIQNLAEWLMEDAAPLLPAKSQKHLTQLQGRVQRLEQLLDGLLAYSRIGRERYAAEMVNTQTVVEELRELLAPPNGFTITAVALPTLVTQRVPLEIVLRNLLSNAIKHHHQPHLGHVQVTAHDLDEWTEFSICDDGPGIAPEFHERIFGMFQVLRPRDQVEGSGIGLALVRKTVESFGGQIWVESSVGTGTTFRFTWLK